VQYTQIKYLQSDKPCALDNVRFTPPEFADAASFATSGRVCRGLRSLGPGVGTPDSGVSDRVTLAAGARPGFKSRPDEDRESPP
jgi:hypothetical protein